VAGAARDRLKVHSPSAVFMDIGEAVGDGFAAGIEGSASATARAYGDLFGAPDSAGAGGGGGLTVVVAEGAIVIEIRGGNEKEIAAEVREVLPGALESAIAQLALQQGAKRG
jgi:hypothetical protein